MSEYKQVKNHIHNTLGIDKEYVQNVIRETVRDEVQKLLGDEEVLSKMIASYVGDAVNSVYGYLPPAQKKRSEYIRDVIRGQIMTAIGQHVLSRLDVSVGLREEVNSVEAD